MGNQFLNTDLNDYEKAFLTALREIKRKSPEVLQSLLSFTNLNRVALPVLDKIGWEVLSPATREFNVVKLRLFHFLLIQFEYIILSLSFEDFSAHFINEKISCGKPIIWLGKNYALPILFKSLRKINIVPEVGNVFDVICIHFVDKNGEELKKRNLENQINKCGPDEQKKIVDISTFLDCK